jgi:N-acetylglutamate synthase-like GNAT family acetyltransferase
MSQERAEDGVVLRDPRPGEFSWLILRHMQTVAADYGWDARYEGHLMEIGARVLIHLDRSCERFWVAEKDGEVVGCVGIVREDEATARLRMMYLEPSARGLGLGRRLVDTCIEFCREKGYAAIVLWTLGVLETARSLYASAGFRMVSSEPWDGIGPVEQDETWRLELKPGASTPSGYSGHN